jgi:hypothetical protein
VDRTIGQDRTGQDRTGQDRTDFKYMIVASHIMACNKNVFGIGLT